MLEYKNYPDNNIVELIVEGKVTEADFERVASQMKADLKKHGKLCVLEEIRSLEGIDPMALWQDIRFGLSHINDFDRVAVVADAQWIQTFAGAIDRVLSAEVKAFDHSQIEAARTWLVANCST